MTTCYPVIDASFSKSGLRPHISYIPDDMRHSQFVFLEAVIRTLMNSKYVEVLCKIGKRIVVGTISANSYFSGCEEYSIEFGNERRLNSFVGICYDYEKDKGILYPDYKQLSDILKDFYKDRWDIERDNCEQFYSSAIELELHRSNNNSDYVLIKSDSLLTIVNPSCSNIFIEDMVGADDSKSHIYINKMPKMNDFSAHIKCEVERNAAANMDEKIKVEEIQIYCSPKSFFNGHRMIKKHVSDKQYC